MNDLVRKEEKPRKKEKAEGRSASDLMVDIESTESDELLAQKESEMAECFNYFGSQAQTQSWFSIHEKEQELLIDRSLLLPCDYH